MPTADLPVGAQTRDIFRTIDGVNLNLGPHDRLRDRGGDLSNQAPLLGITPAAYPRIVLRDSLGYELDTYTTLQEAIYRAKWNVRTTGQSRTPLEWRLPKAPPPARPDLTRTFPPVKHPQVPGGPGKMAGNTGNILEIDVDDVSFVKESLDRLPYVPSLSFLRQEFLVGPKTYFQIVGTMLLHKRLLTETEKRHAIYNFPGFCSGCIRMGLCYGCERSSEPHYHEDKLVKTGGGFTYYKKDRPEREMKHKNPLNWKINHPDQVLKRLMEDYAGVHLDGDVSSKIKEHLDAHADRRARHVSEEGDDFGTGHPNINNSRGDDGRFLPEIDPRFINEQNRDSTLLGYSTPGQGHGRGQSVDRSLDPSDVDIEVYEHEQGQRKALSKRSTKTDLNENYVTSGQQQAGSREINGARSKGDKSDRDDSGTRYNNYERYEHRLPKYRKTESDDDTDDDDRRNYEGDDESRGRRKDRLYKPPPAFKVKKSPKRKIEARSPFSTDRSYDIPKGQDFVPRKSSKKPTEFVDFRNVDASWKEPKKFELKKSNHKPTKFWSGAKPKKKEKSRSRSPRARRPPSPRSPSPDSGLDTGFMTALVRAKSPKKKKTKSESPKRVRHKKEKKTDKHDIEPEEKATRVRSPGYHNPLDDVSDTATEFYRLQSELTGSEEDLRIRSEWEKLRQADIGEAEESKAVAGHKKQKKNIYESRSGAISPIVYEREHHPAESEVATRDPLEDTNEKVQDIPEGPLSEEQARQTSRRNKCIKRKLSKNNRPRDEITFNSLEYNVERNTPLDSASISNEKSGKYRFNSPPQNSRSGNVTNVNHGRRIYSSTPVHSRERNTFEISHSSEEENDKQLQHPYKLERSNAFVRPKTKRKLRAQKPDIVGNDCLTDDLSFIENSTEPSRIYNSEENSDRHDKSLKPNCSDATPPLLSDENKHTFSTASEFPKIKINKQKPVSRRTREYVILPEIQHSTSDASLSQKHISDNDGRYSSMIENRSIPDGVSDSEANSGMSEPSLKPHCRDSTSRLSTEKNDQKFITHLKFPTIRVRTNKPKQKRRRTREQDVLPEIHYTRDSSEHGRISDSKEYSGRSDTNLKPYCSDSKHRLSTDNDGHQFNTTVRFPKIQVRSNEANPGNRSAGDAISLPEIQHSARASSALKGRAQNNYVKIGFLPNNSLRHGNVSDSSETDDSVLLNKNTINSKDNRSLKQRPKMKRKKKHGGNFRNDRTYKAKNDSLQTTNHLPEETTYLDNKSKMYYGSEMSYNDSKESNPSYMSGSRRKMKKTYQQNKRGDDIGVIRQPDGNDSDTDAMEQVSAVENDGPESQIQSPPEIYQDGQPLGKLRKRRHANKHHRKQKTRAEDRHPEGYGRNYYETEKTRSSSKDSIPKEYFVSRTLNQLSNAEGTDKDSLHGEFGEDDESITAVSKGSIEDNNNKDVKSHIEIRKEPHMDPKRHDKHLVTKSEHVDSGVFHSDDKDRLVETERQTASYENLEPDNNGEPTLNTDGDYFKHFERFKGRNNVLSRFHERNNTAYPDKYGGENANDNECVKGHTEMRKETQIHPKRYYKHLEAKNIHEDSGVFNSDDKYRPDDTKHQTISYENSVRNKDPVDKIDELHENIEGKNNLRRMCQENLNNADDAVNNDDKINNKEYVKDHTEMRKEPQENKKRHDKRLVAKNEHVDSGIFHSGDKDRLDYTNNRTISFESTESINKHESAVSTDGQYFERLENLRDSNARSKLHDHLNTESDSPPYFERHQSLAYDISHEDRDYPTSDDGNIGDIEDDSQSESDDLPWDVTNVSEHLQKGNRKPPKADRDVREVQTSYNKTNSDENNDDSSEYDESTDNFDYEHRISNKSNTDVNDTETILLSTQSSRKQHEDKHLNLSQRQKTRELSMQVDNDCEESGRTHIPIRYDRRKDDVDNESERRASDSLGNEQLLSSLKTLNKEYNGHTYESEYTFSNKTISDEDERERQPRESLIRRNEKPSYRMLDNDEKYETWLGRQQKTSNEDERGNQFREPNNRRNKKVSKSMLDNDENEDYKTGKQANTLEYDTKEDKTLQRKFNGEDKSWNHIRNKKTTKKMLDNDDDEYYGTVENVDSWLERQQNTLNNSSDEDAETSYMDINIRYDADRDGGDEYAETNRSDRNLAHDAYNDGTDADYVARRGRFRYRKQDEKEIDLRRNRASGKNFHNSKGEDVETNRTERNLGYDVNPDGGEFDNVSCREKFRRRKQGKKERDLVGKHTAGKYLNDNSDEDAEINRNKRYLEQDADSDLGDFDNVARIGKSRSRKQRENEMDLIGKPTVRNRVQNRAEDGQRGMVNIGDDLMHSVDNEHPPARTSNTKYQPQDRRKNRTRYLRRAYSNGDFQTETELRKRTLQQEYRKAERAHSKEYTSEFPLIFPGGNDPINRSASVDLRGGCRSDMYRHISRNARSVSEPHHEHDFIRGDSNFQSDDVFEDGEAEKRPSMTSVRTISIDMTSLSSHLHMVEPDSSSSLSGDSASPPIIPSNLAFDAESITSQEPELDLVFDDVIDVANLEIDDETTAGNENEKRRRKQRHKRRRRKHDRNQEEGNRMEQADMTDKQRKPGDSIEEVGSIDKQHKPDDLINNANPNQGIHPNDGFDDEVFFEVVKQIDDETRQFNTPNHFTRTDDDKHTEGPGVGTLTDDEVFHDDKGLTENVQSDDENSDHEKDQQNGIDFSNGDVVQVPSDCNEEKANDYEDSDQDQFETFRPKSVGDTKINRNKDSSYIVSRVRDGQTKQSHPKRKTRGHRKHGGDNGIDLSNLPSIETQIAKIMYNYNYDDQANTSISGRTSSRSSRRHSIATPKLNNKSTYRSRSVSKGARSRGSSVKRALRKKKRSQSLPNTSELIEMMEQLDRRTDDEANGHVSVPVYLGAFPSRIIKKQFKTTMDRKRVPGRDRSLSIFESDEDGTNKSELEPLREESQVIENNDMERVLTPSTTRIPTPASTNSLLSTGSPRHSNISYNNTVTKPIVTQGEGHSKIVDGDKATKVSNHTKIEPPKSPVKREIIKKERRPKTPVPAPVRSPTPEEEPIRVSPSPEPVDDGEPVSREISFEFIREPPELPPIEIPELPDIPETQPTEYKGIKREKKLIEVTPELPAQKKKLPPPPKSRPQYRSRAPSRKTKVAEAPVTTQELQQMVDPLDFLAKYCIINPDRLPFYERVFNGALSVQTPRYNRGNEAPKGAIVHLPPAQLSDHELNMLKDITVLNQGHCPRNDGISAPEQYLEKLNYSIEFIKSKQDVIQTHMEKVQAEKMQFMAGMAKKWDRDIARLDYKTKTKKKKKKKKKKKGEEPDYDQMGALSDKTNFQPMKASDITDEVIVSRMDDKMMKKIKKDPVYMKYKMEIGRDIEKLKHYDERVAQIEDEKDLVGLYCMDYYFSEQGAMNRPHEFRRQQSRLYQKLHPDPDIEMNVEEVEPALQQINNKLLTEREFQYIYFILDLPKREKINFRLFSIVAALSEKVTQMDPVIRKLINKVDYNALDVKMEKSKELFQLLQDERVLPQGNAPSDNLAVELTAGGLSPEHTTYLFCRLRPLSNWTSLNLKNSLGKILAHSNAPSDNLAVELTAGGLSPEHTTYDQSKSKEFVREILTHSNAPSDNLGVELTAGGLSPEHTTYLFCRLRPLSNWTSLNLKNSLGKILTHSNAPSDNLAVELTAGGLSPEHTTYVMNKFDREGRGFIDFLDFVTYVPLFIEIHSRIIDDPFNDSFCV